MIKLIKISSLWIAIFFCSTLFASENMANLLQQVKQSITVQQQKESQRLLTFKQKKADKLVLLTALDEELKQAMQRQTELVDAVNSGAAEQTILVDKLGQHSAQLQALFSVSKKNAVDFTKETANSLSSGRYLERHKELAFAFETTIPSVQNLKTLWFMLLQEMVANAGVQVFNTATVDAGGEIATQQVYQLGPFAAVSAQGQYLRFNQASGKLQVIEKQSEDLKELAQNFVSGNANTIVIDPEKGTLLIQSTLLPTFEQRIHQGGLVGYIILGLGALGLLVALWRLLYMTWVGFKINAQFKRSEALATNPLGRVLQAAKGVKDVQCAELLIDKAMLQEVTKLERCHSFVKLLAAVAPLLGLLGTVTGMIETFQSITLVGTSDPKLMAGGISQALITTVMGLCVAIPLLFAHSFISAKSKLLLQQIQQQSLLLLSTFFSAKPIELKSASVNGAQIEEKPQSKTGQSTPHERSAIV
ncbi:MAG: biopolymer transport protein ExbB [Oceanospirillaceae bacterium]|jgi:biopolymer transport protein ExbB